MDQSNIDESQQAGQENAPENGYAKEAQKTSKKSLPKEESYIRHRNANHIEISPIKWLWPNKFALGKLSIIAGNPGLGKSQVTASIAAIASRGDKWPDDSESKLGRVIFLSAEDSAEDTIIPRLIAAGADLSKITFAELLVTTKDKNFTLNPIDIAKDLVQLEQLINHFKDVVAVIIDPISAYIPNANDSNNVSIRSVLAPLSELASRLGVAIICVSHNNKNSDQQAIFRIIGSIGFVAAARAAFLVTKDKDDPNTLLFLPVKNNISQDKTGLSFQIEPCTIENDIKTSRVKWSEKTITLTADEAIGSQTQSDDHSSLDEAEEFLNKTLASGPIFSKVILEQAKAEMIRIKTLRRAKKNLKIVVGRSGFGKGSKPFWRLPNQAGTPSIDDQKNHTLPSNEVTTYDENGHLLDS